MRAIVEVWCVGVSEGVMVKVSQCHRCVACSDVPPPAPSACARPPLPPTPCRFLDCKEANADKFFTPAQRSMIVWDILQRVPYGDKEEQYGEGQGRGMYAYMYVGGWVGQREVEL